MKNLIRFAIVILALSLHSSAMADDNDNDESKTKEQLQTKLDDLKEKYRLRKAILQKQEDIDNLKPSRWVAMPGIMCNSQDLL